MARQQLLRCEISQQLIGSSEALQGRGLQGVLLQGDCRDHRQGLVGHVDQLLLFASGGYQRTPVCEEIICITK